MSLPVATKVGNIKEAGSDGTIVIPNTTPPAVGDYLVVFIAAYQSGSSRNLGSTPAGWTFHVGQTGDGHVCGLYTKRAEAADVIAAGFTFTVSAAVDVFTGVCFKVTNVPNGAEIAGAEYDSGTTSFTFTTAITPDTPEALAIMMFTDSQNSSGGLSISSYASTPAETWTELLDDPGNNGTPSMSFGVASAPLSGLDEMTQRTATASAATSKTRGLIIVLNGTVDAAGTAALLSQAPVFFAPAVQAGTTGTVALLEQAPTIFAPTVTESSPSQKWKNTDKPDPAVVVNTDK